MAPFLFFINPLKLLMMETTPQRTLQVLKNKKKVTKRDLIDLTVIASTRFYRFNHLIPDDFRDEYIELCEIMVQCVIKS